MRVGRALALMLVALGAWPAGAVAGEVALGVELGPSPDVVRFDTAAPGTLTARTPVNGLLAGETIVGIDLRPASGELFGLTSTNRMLIVDPETGAVQQVGASLDATLFASNQLGGFDFNPTVDRLRLVNAVEDNMRFNPLTFVPVDGDAGTPGTQPDTDLAFAVGDPNAGANPNVVASAYTNNDNDPATPTTLFGIDSGFDVLVRQGGVDGSPSPNLGQLFTVGGLGVDVVDAALDVVRGASAGGNVAYAAMRGASGGSTLYTIALGGGTASSLGAIDGAALSGLAIMVGGAFRVASAQTTVGEAGSSVSVEISRTGETLAPAQVGYRTTDRTAVAGSDYGPVSGTLDFAQGERTKSVAIPVLNDGAVEGTETLALQLGPVSRGAVLDTREHTIAISDDDQAADRLRPTLLLAPARVRSLRALSRSGKLRVRVGCSEACRVVLTLKLRRTRLGRGTASLRSAGVKRATVRLTRKGRRTLKRRRRGATLSLGAVATDCAGNRSTRTVKLRLRRR